MSRNYTREDLEKLTYEELRRLAAELEAEGAQIKKVRHYFSEEFWRRIKEKSVKPEELREGAVVGVKIGERQVLLAKVEGRVYALSNRCPHKGFPLHKGRLEGHTLTCAYHGGRFDIRTGACLKHPYETYPCKSFGVRVLEDETIECEEIS